MYFRAESYDYITFLVPVEQTCGGLLGLLTSLPRQFVQTLFKISSLVFDVFDFPNQFFVFSVLND